MGKESDKLAYSASIAAEEAAGYLESLAEGLRKHALRVDAGSQSIAVMVAPKVAVALDIRAEARKSTMQLTLSWRPADAAPRPGLSILTPNASDSGASRRQLTADSTNGASPRRQRARRTPTGRKRASKKTRPTGKPRAS